MSAAQLPESKPPPPANTAAKTRPNLLLLILDDVGRDKLACYGLGDPDTMPYTPNIDRLAADGIRFDNFYTNPNCSPSRAQMITGRHAFRNGVRNVIRPFQKTNALPYEEVILPEVLEQVGYAHSQIGKWHLGSLLLDGPLHAINSGWDYTIGMEGNPNSRGQSYYRWLQQENGVVRWREGYLTSATVDDTLDRIEAMPEPWHAWVAFNAGHGPLEAPPPDLHYGDPNALGKDPVQLYRAMVEAMDTEIGRLLDQMPRGVRNRTTVILVADNGSSEEVIVPPLPRTQGKGTLFEGGVHVPLIISGFSVPKFNRGRVADKLVSSVDLFTTMVDLAGASLPTDRVIDGVSLRPVLYDPTFQAQRRVIAERYDRGLVGDVMITNGRYKLIRQHPNSGVDPAYQFYDLLNAAEGTDGPNLCDCPLQLSGPALQSFLRLDQRLVEYYED